MPLIELAIAVLVAGVVIWLVNAFIPMDQRFKTIFIAIVVLILILYALQALGIWGGSLRR